MKYFLDLIGWMIILSIMALALAYIIPRIL